MAAENIDIRNLIDRDLEGIVEPDQITFEPLDLANRIMPGLFKEVVDTADDEEQKKKLQSVQDLLGRRAIAIAFDAFMQPATNLSKDIGLRRVRAPQRKGFRLFVLVNPTVAYLLESHDDRPFAINRVKEVMLEAHEAHKELVQNRQFIPNYEV